MPRTTPWFSVNPQDRRVHHVDSICPEGARIAREHRREGNGGLPLCEQCARMQPAPKTP